MEGAQAEETISRALPQHFYQTDLRPLVRWRNDPTRGPAVLFSSSLLSCPACSGSTARSLSLALCLLTSCIGCEARWRAFESLTWGEGEGEGGSGAVDTMLKPD